MIRPKDRIISFKRKKSSKSVNPSKREQLVFILKKSIEVFKAAPRFRRKLDRKWAWKSRALLKKGV